MCSALQANWHDQSLYLWARAEKGAAPVDVSALRAAVGEVSSDALLASAAPEGVFTIALPDQDEEGRSSGDGGAVATAPLTKFQTASVTALILGPAEAIDFLTSLPRDIPAGCGPSVAYWATLAHFVCQLVAARQFMPRLESAEDGSLSACWRLLVSDRAQLEWLEQFAQAMPPVCRAGGSGAEPDHLIETFLSAATDALIRRAVADDEFFQRIHERAAADNATPDLCWVSALLGAGRQFRMREDEDEDATAAFAQQAQAWLGQLDDSQVAALRLVFVLHEPPEEEEPETLTPEILAELDAIEDTADEGENGEAAAPAAQPESHEETGAVPVSELTVHLPPEVAPPSEVVPAAEVAPPPADWLVTLHLQGLDGEGELIDAQSLWQGAGKSAILGRSVAKRQAALLAELSRAVEVFPPAQTLLAHPAPTQLALSTADAYAFIRHWAPILRDRGFGVTLPDWANYPDEEVGLRLVLSPTQELDELFDPAHQAAAAASSARSARIGEAIEFSTGQFGLESLMNFDWQIAIGNVRLNTADFEHLVAQNQPLVKHQGRWIHIDLDATRRAIEFVKKKQGGQITLADAFRTAFTAQKGETGLNVIGLSGTSWLEQLLEQAPGKSIESITQPRAFEGDLRPYQLRGLHWLTFLDRLGLGACLADDMGLGKTIQLIALLLSERERAEEIESARLRSVAAAEETAGAPRPSAPPTPRPGPTLLFAPTSVVGNWLRELQRFAKPLKLMVHHGADRLSGETFAREAQSSDVVITSYSLAHRDKEDFARVNWHRIALDEAQKIKNPAAAATIAIRSIYAPRRIAMTGTPIENHLSELWSIMQVLNPGLLGTAADFREKFAVPIEKLGEKDRAEQLRKMIRPFILRRTKMDPTIAGDLPEKLEFKVFCNLTAEQAALYERFVNDSLRQIDSASGIRRRGLILATLTRLKQICDHPALLEENPATYDHRSGKCERLVDMLEEMLEEGDAALVFTQYREMGHILERLIKARLGAETFFLHGGTPAKGRDDMIQKFQEQKGAPRIFLLSLRAGGLGLNLTAANHVFHFDRWWNPAVEAQATDRAHRVGQTRTVQVHKFVCIGTMEERIDKLLSEKQALADQIVGSGDEWLTNLSTDQLRDYLSLSKEAVGEFE
jgi:SNF2 family DNA or RNA helicase